LPDHQEVALLEITQILMLVHATYMCTIEDALVLGIYASP